MALRGALSDADDRERAAAQLQLARSVQRAALAGSRGGAVAAAAARLSALADGVPTVSSLERSGLFRGDGERHALDHSRRRWSPGPAQRRDPGWTDAAEQLRKWSARGLRWLQAAPGQQAPYGRGYAGATDRADGDAGERAGARTGQGTVRGGAGRHGRNGGGGVGGPGLHGRGNATSGQGGRDRSSNRQTSRGEKRIRAAAPALGRGAQFRLDVPVQKAEPGFRADARGAGRIAFRGFLHPHAAQGCALADVGRKFITRSKGHDLPNVMRYLM